MKILISKAIMGWNISYDEFISIKNVLKKYDEVNEEIKNLDLNSSSTILVYL